MTRCSRETPANRSSRSPVRRMTSWSAVALAGVLVCLMLPLSIHAGTQARTRARDLRIPFSGSPGPQNAITDVNGILVGHATLIKGHGALEVGTGPVRTGVTAILPRGKTYEPVFAAWATLNGNGEMTGTT